MSNESIKLFISYSHKDEVLREELATHLAIMKRQGEITTWYDRQIGAGSEWANQIDNNLKKADIILLLISSYFLASDYCYDIELKLAMKRHEAGEALVVPIILRPVNWSGAPFGKLQAYPKDAKPVTSWANQDEAFMSVIQGIRIAVNNLRELRQQKLQQKETAINQYKKKVEEALSDGKISLPERDTLDELRDELGLTAEDASEIEKLAFEPWKRYEENLQKYKKTLIKVIEHEYPFSEQTQRDLELRQRDLGIKTEDVACIQQPILAQAEANYQEKLQEEQEAEAKQLELQKQQEKEEYENKLRHYEQEFLKAVEGEYPLSEVVRNRINSLQQSLGLKAEDVARIQQPFIAQAEAQYQEKLQEEQKAEAKRLELQKQQEKEEYENKLRHYEQEFLKVIEREYPLSEVVRNEFNSLQQSLGLKAEDVAQIEQPILAQAEAKYQEKLQQEQVAQQQQKEAERAKQLELQKQQEKERYGNKLRHYKQEFLKAIEREYPLSEVVRNEFNSLQQSLGLKAEDVTRIEQPILAQAEAKYQGKLEAEQTRRQQQQEAERVQQLEVQRQKEWETQKQQHQPTKKHYQSFTKLTGHSEMFAGVRSVAISPDGQIIASGSEDNTIKLWNLETKQEIRTLSEHSSLVRAVTFSLDGKILVSCSNDKSIKLWNWKTGEEIGTLTGHSKEVTTVAISPNGETLASGSDDKTIKLWSLKTKQEICTLSGHSGYVQSVAFSPDGQTLASGGTDYTIKLWSISTYKEILSLADSINVRSVAISPNGQTLASGNLNSEVKVWNLPTGKLRQTLSGHLDSFFGSGVLSVAISPDGRILASGCNLDKTIKLWNLATGELLQTLSGHSKGVTSVVFSPDGQNLISGSYDKTIRVWY
ncbi:TIR domain-containing protein [Nostoc sp. ChiQUE01b]|uniref:TIR domain-containing protein n=1 Tax=Nostoc sp. ChiQUE01b TaxID=3075376 RepID=UPI002AD2D816|nr:TIR domain-containing protein [Nostoc sp. ChiQUE01b]MDZ8258093.1 TIR domain-containing protein [Nostoc sp. ChiQUE01b]